MKNFLYLFGFVLILITGCSSSDKTLNEVPENSREIVYQVYGMDCPGCEGGLEKLFDKNKAVITSEADWTQQKISIYVHKDAELSKEEIETIIKKANFTPGEQVK